MLIFSFERLISEAIKVSWKLDDSLKGTGLISEVKIIEVGLMKNGEVDEIKNKIVEVPTVHILVEVKVKPIILNSFFEDKFRFKLHEDVRIEKYNLGA